MKWLALALLVACNHVDPIEPGQCLALPGSSRVDLIADPMGDGLFWLQPADTQDIEANVRRSWNLMRYDLAQRRLDLILDHVNAPLNFVRDKILTLRTVGTKTLVMIERDGRVHTLLPTYLEASDVEMIDDHTIAVLADGDGPRAIYTIDVDRPRPVHLIDADVLLSASSGHVFAVAGQEGVSVELATGKQQHVDLPKDHTHPQGEDSWYVDDLKVRAWPMRAGKDRVAISRRAKWKLVDQLGSVLARTAPAKDRSEAYLLSLGIAHPLPTVVGGTSIVSATNVGGKIWALVGHNTGNYIGDLGEIDSEADVCLLPASGDVAFPTRTVPMQYVDRSVALFGRAEQVAPGSIVQILNGPDAPITISYTLKEAGHMDLSAMRDRARDVHRRSTSVLGDRELRTEVVFADEGIAIARWRRERLGDRVVAGMGDVLLSDPADFDLEVRDLVDEKRGDAIQCAGTLVNTHDRTLRNLAIRCVAGDRIRVIAIPELGPNAEHTFSQAFDSDEDEAPFFEVVSGREPLAVRDAKAEAAAANVLDIAKQVYDETQLALVTHTTKDTFAVNVRTTMEFETQPEDARMLRVTNAYRRYDALRALYRIDPTAHLTLHIDVIDDAYEFDGVQLTRL